MMIEGILIGLIPRAFTQVLALFPLLGQWFMQKSQHKYNLEMKKLDIDRIKLNAQFKLKESQEDHEAESELNQQQIDAAYDALNRRLVHKENFEPTGNKWLDFMRLGARPIMLYWSLLFYTGFKAIAALLAWWMLRSYPDSVYAYTYASNLLTEQDLTAIFAIWSHFISERIIEKKNDK